MVSRVAEELRKAEEERKPKKKPEGGISFGNPGNTTMRYRVQIEPTDPAIAASLKRQNEQREEYTEAASPEQAERFIKHRYPSYRVKAVFPDPRGANPNKKVVAAILGIAIIGFLIVTLRAERQYA